MVKQWVYEKAVELYEDEKVEFDFTDRQGKAHFLVEDDREYIVQVDDNLKYYCDCSFGVGQGVNGARCTHQVAVETWCIMKAGKGTFNFQVFRKDRETRNVEKEGREELSSQQKKVLRELLDCEMCGEDKVQLHRIKRQGPYQLRNIMPLCDKCHKRIHGKEKGHYYK